MKCRDAIIDELHRVREDIGKAHDFDVRRIAATIRQREDVNPDGVVRESPKRTTRQTKGLVARQRCRRVRCRRPSRIIDLCRGEQPRRI
jgi:hypothetical protein